MSKVREIRPGILSEAADGAAFWFTREQGGLDDREEHMFASWLEASPENRAAYDDVARGWDYLGMIASQPEILAVRETALSSSRRGFAPKAWSAAAALVLALGSTAGFYVASQLQPTTDSRLGGVTPRVVQTAVGERSTFAMSDGSIVTLNTNSKVRIALSANSRNITLVSGQAFFQVAKDKARPFIVTAGDRQVVAVGTEFDVRLQPRGVNVALLEGRVNVRRTPSSNLASRKGPPAVLTPGQLLFADKGTGQVTIRSMDIAASLSWREGRVRFEATPLAEAVAEMNRYSVVSIRIVDPRIASLRISGAFRTGQSASFVSSIAGVLPVEAKATPSGYELRAVS